eukprot:COSAG01_NODE_3317_length_6273_cov_4.748461_6_plen_227_part_00
MVRVGVGGKGGHVVAASTGALLRAEPSRGAAVLTQLPHGAVVTKLGEDAAAGEEAAAAVVPQCDPSHAPAVPSSPGSLGSPAPGQTLGESAVLVGPQDYETTPPSERAPAEQMPSPSEAPRAEEGVDAEVHTAAVGSPHEADPPANAAATASAVEAAPATEPPTLPPALYKVLKEATVRAGPDKDSAKLGVYHLRGGSTTRAAGLPELLAEFYLRLESWCRPAEFM